MDENALTLSNAYFLQRRINLPPPANKGITNRKTELLASVI